MSTKRIMAGLYEVLTERGTFHIDTMAGKWYVRTPNDRTFHVPTYRDARRVVNHWCTCEWSHEYDGYDGLEFLAYRA